MIPGHVETKTSIFFNSFPNATYKEFSPYLVATTVNGFDWKIFLWFVAEKLNIEELHHNIDAVEVNQQVNIQT